MIEKITKNDLVESISLNTNIYKKDIASVVDALFEVMKEELAQGSTIELRGFGTFEPRLRKAKSSARNPKTGEKISVDSHYVAAFRAGKELKEKLWNLNKK